MLESKTDYYRLLSQAFGISVPSARDARKRVYNEMRKALKEQAKLAPNRFDLAAEQRALEKAILDVEISAKLGQPIPHGIPGADPKYPAGWPSPVQPPAPPANPFIPPLGYQPVAPDPAPAFPTPYVQQAMPRIEWVDPHMAAQETPPGARAAGPMFQPGFLNLPDRVSYARHADPTPPPKPKQAPPPPAPTSQTQPQSLPNEQARADLQAALPSPEALAGDVHVLDASQSKLAGKAFSPHDKREERPRIGTARMLFIVLLAACMGGAITYVAKPEQFIPRLIAAVQSGWSAFNEAEKSPPSQPTGASVSLGEQRDPTVQELIHLAISQTSQREYSRALAALEEAQKMGASGADFYQARAYANWGAGDTERAIADYSEAIRLDPGNGANYTNRAVSYNARGEYTLAIRDLERAIAIEPNNADNWNSRCWARALAGQLQEAILDCNEALRLRPNDPNTLDSRGFAQLKAGQNSRAIADFEAALKIDPRIASSIYGRGLARMRSGDRINGYADIAEARTINPNIEAVFAKYGVR